MSRLIDADKLYDYISDVFTQFGHDVMSVKDALEAVENAPTVNAVELPCIAMVEQSLKNGKFDKTHTSYNGKIAVVYIDKRKFNIPLIDITSRHYNTCEAYDRVNQLNEEAEQALRERGLK